MKNFALAATFSGFLLFAGAAFGAEKEQTAGQVKCFCSSQSEKTQGSGSTFKPLFPEFEIEPRIEG